MAKLPKDVKTPNYRYYIPILRALRGKGGRAAVADVYPLVQDQLSDVLNDFDYENVPNESKPEPRWMVSMRWARDEMLEKGMLASSELSGRGYWEMLPEGEKYLNQWAQETKAPDIWPPKT